MTADPTRLLDSSETPPALQSLLTAAGSDVLDSDGVARVRAGVAQQVGAASAGAATGGVLGKLMAGLVVGGIVAAVALLPDHGSRSSGDAISRLEIDEPPVYPRSQVVVPFAAHTTPAERPPSEPAVATPRRRTVPMQTQDALEPPPAAPLPQEARLLLAARRVLEVDPGRALRLTERHAREFHDGVLAAERELLAIRALVALGQNEAARRRANAFASRFPGSAHHAAVRAAVGARDTANP